MSMGIKGRCGEGAGIGVLVDVEKATKLLDYIVLNCHGDPMDYTALGSGCAELNLILHETSKTIESQDHRDPVLVKDPASNDAVNSGFDSLIDSVSISCTICSKLDCARDGLTVRFLTL